MSKIRRNRHRSQSLVRVYRKLNDIQQSVPGSSRNAGASAALAETGERARTTAGIARARPELTRARAERTRAEREPAREAIGDGHGEQLPAAAVRGLAAAPPAPAATDHQRSQQELAAGEAQPQLPEYGDSAFLLVERDRSVQANVSRIVFLVTSGATHSLY